MFTCNNNNKLYLCSIIHAYNATQSASHKSRYTKKLKTIGTRKLKIKIKSKIKQPSGINTSKESNIGEYNNNNRIYRIIIIINIVIIIITIIIIIIIIIIITMCDTKGHDKGF